MRNNEAFQPMLAKDASEEDYKRLFQERGTLWASYKLDGIRATVFGGQLVSRSLKPIPNNFTRSWLSAPVLEGLDGELICGEPCGEGVFARSTSAFMSQWGEPHFVYHVFDDHSHEGTFQERSIGLIKRFESIMDEGPNSHFKRVVQFPVDNLKELLDLEQHAIRLGYEGLIVRDPAGPYKYGRSTLKQAWMLKLKRFADSEAEVIGFEELYRNANEAFADERGYAKRSSAKAGQIPAGVLGALNVRDTRNASWVFNIGSGFDQSQRADIWARRGEFLGRIVKYKYLPVGTADLPRHPIFLGWRDRRDL